MGNKLDQSRKFVNKATSLFSKAIEDVEKANTLLMEAMNEDAGHIEATKERIKEQENFVVSLEEQMESKVEEFDENTDLITKLKEFAK